MKTGWFSLREVRLHMAPYSGAGGAPELCRLQLHTGQVDLPTG